MCFEIASRVDIDHQIWNRLSPFATHRNLIVLDLLPCRLQFGTCRQQLRECLVPRQGLVVRSQTPGQARIRQICYTGKRRQHSPVLFKLTLCFPKIQAVPLQFNFNPQDVRLRSLAKIVHFTMRFKIVFSIRHKFFMDTHQLLRCQRIVKLNSYIIQDSLLLSIEVCLRDIRTLHVLRSAEFQLATGHEFLRNVSSL